MLDHAKDRADQDQRHAGVHHERKSRDRFGVDVVLVASPVEDPRKTVECENQAYLNPDRSENQHFPRLALAAFRVGGEGYSQGVQRLNDHHDGSENGEDSSGRDGRLIWNVEESSTESVVVGELEKWTVVMEFLSVDERKRKEADRKNAHGQT